MSRTIILLALVAVCTAVPIQPKNQTFNICDMLVGGQSICNLPGNEGLWDINANNSTELSQRFVITTVIATAAIGAIVNQLVGTGWDALMESFGKRDLAQIGSVCNLLVGGQSVCNYPGYENLSEELKQILGLLGDKLKEKFEALTHQRIIDPVSIIATAVIGSVVSQLVGTGWDALMGSFGK